MSRTPNTTARNANILSPAFHSKTILMAGVSGGSIMGVKLARQHPQEIRAIDPGHVKPSTLSRTVFNFEDAQMERPKVEAFKNRVDSLFAPGQAPVIDVHHDRIENLSKEVFAACDLMIAGTDNRDAQAYLSDIAVQTRTPYVAIGLHNQAKGGHIIYKVPGDNHACYRCGLAERFETDDDDINLDGEVGNLVDVQGIDMTAMRICLAILDRGQTSAMGRFYETIRHKGYVVVANHPDYEYGNSLVEALLGDLPNTPKPFAQELKQYGFLAGYTVWLESAPDPECPICHPAVQGSKP